MIKFKYGSKPVQKDTTGTNKLRGCVLHNYLTINPLNGNSSHLA